MNILTNVGNLQINELPNSCPFCHRSITPNLLYGFRKNPEELEVMMYCPDAKCKSSFIGYYKNGTSNKQLFHFEFKVTQGTLIGKKFSKIIDEVSPKFSDIYNQARSAEQQNLTDVCGCGYRKALEFLIKDYVIAKNPDKEDKIKNQVLSSCIKDYIEDSRIVSVAKRAAWLGNDETHYVRKWEEKNLKDLKSLIDLTVHWVEMEKLTESFETEMQEK